jgi:hypothetical protein
MHEKILLSTAYLPPVQYFSLIKISRAVLIEAKENYIKQTYRNRCYILSSGGPLLLPLPVYEGSRRKVPIREDRIDYTKRWQQVHLRAIRAAYGNSPFFDFYFEELEQIILWKHECLFDLNDLLLRKVLRMLKIEREISNTTEYAPEVRQTNDFRYSLTPEKRQEFINRRYLQVFGNEFTSNLSIIDLIFNMGPEAGGYL